LGVIIAYLRYFVDKFLFFCPDKVMTSFNIYYPPRVTLILLF